MTLSEAAAQAAEFSHIAALALGAFGGLWAAASKAIKRHKAWVLENTASKEDMARIEGKVDGLVVLLTPPPTVAAPKPVRVLRPRSEA